jgi:hypothetical protein
MIWLVPILEAVATVVATVLMKTVKDWAEKTGEPSEKAPPCIETNTKSKRKSAQQTKRSR